MSGVIRTSVSPRRRCRMISCAAANGIRWVKPSSATVSPSRTSSDTACASDRILATDETLASRTAPRQSPATNGGPHRPDEQPEPNPGQAPPRSRAVTARTAAVVAARSTRVGSPVGQHLLAGHPDVAHRPASRRPTPGWTAAGRRRRAPRRPASSRSTCTRSAQRPGSSAPEVVAADRRRAVPGGHQQQLGRGERGGVAAGHPGQQAGQPGLGPQVEIVARRPGRRCPGRPGPRPGAARVTRATPAASLAFEPGQCATAAPRAASSSMSASDSCTACAASTRPSEHAELVQQRRHRAVRGALRRASSPRGLGDVDVQQCAALPGVLADRGQRLGRQGVGGVRAVAQLDPLARPEPQPVARRSARRRRRASAPSCPAGPSRARR